MYLLRTLTGTTRWSCNYSSVLEKSTKIVARLRNGLILHNDFLLLISQVLQFVKVLNILYHRVCPRLCCLLFSYVPREISGSSTFVLSITNSI